MKGFAASKYLVLIVGAILLFNLSFVSAEEIELNDSGVVEYAETGTGYMNITNKDFSTPGGWTTLTPVKLFLDDYKITYHVEAYFEVYDGYLDEYTYYYCPDSDNHSTCKRIDFDTGTGYCTDIQLSHDYQEPVEGYLCVYPYQKNQRFKAIFDFQDDWESWNTSATGEVFADIEYPNGDAFKYKHADSPNSNPTQNNRDDHFAWLYAVNFQSFETSWFSYSAGNKYDIWEYNYYYNSSKNVEDSYFNVTKTMDGTKWHSLNWSSLLLYDGENYYNDNIEADYSTDNLSVHKSGYMADVTVDFTTTTNETIYFPLPYEEEEEEEEPAPGQTCYTFWAYDPFTGALMNDVTLNIWGGYNLTREFDQSTTVCIDNGTEFEWNITKDGYFLVGGGGSSVSGEDDETDKDLSLAADDDNLEEYDIDDPDNYTALIYRVLDDDTNSTIERALVTSAGASQYTNEFGLTYFEVEKNTSSIKYEVEKSGYYGAGGYASVGANITVQDVSLIPVSTPEPEETETVTDHRESAEQTLNEAQSYAPQIFMLVLFMFILAVMKKGMGGK